MSDKIAFDEAITALNTLTKAVLDRESHTDIDLQEMLLTAMHKDYVAESGLDIGWWAHYVTKNKLMPLDWFITLAEKEFPSITQTELSSITKQG